MCVCKEEQEQEKNRKYEERTSLKDRNYTNTERKKERKEERKKEKKKQWKYMTERNKQTNKQTNKQKCSFE